MKKNWSIKPLLKQNRIRISLRGLVYTKKEEDLSTRPPPQKKNEEELLDQASFTPEMKKNCFTRTPPDQKRRRVALPRLIYAKNKRLLYGGPRENPKITKANQYFHQKWFLKGCNRFYLDTSINIGLILRIDLAMGYPAFQFNKHFSVFPSVATQTQNR